jgi:hypothetical protein
VLRNVREIQSLGFKFHSDFQTTRPTLEIHGSSRDEMLYQQLRTHARLENFFPDISFVQTGTPPIVMHQDNSFFPSGG